MMVPVDDDEDDFIVQTVEDTGASDARQQGSWSLKSLGGLVFASTSGRASTAEVEPEPEPTLPAGFSSTLNAEEEKIYPAEVRIDARVLPTMYIQRITHTHTYTLHHREKEAHTIFRPFCVLFFFIRSCCCASLSHCPRAWPWNQS